MHELTRSVPGSSSLALSEEERTNRSYERSRMHVTCDRCDVFQIRPLYPVDINPLHSYAKPEGLDDSRVAQDFPCLSHSDRATPVTRHLEMADPSPQDSPLEQDSLFGSSRRTSAQADGPPIADIAPKVFADATEPLLAVSAPEDDHEPTEDELKRNRDRFEVELEVSEMCYCGRAVIDRLGCSLSSVWLLPTTCMN